MNLNRRQYSVTTGVVIGLAFCFLLNFPAQAQFTADYQTNTISGVTSNWSGDYNVGSGYSFDQLQTIDGGFLAVSSDLYDGYNGGNANSMVISNGGKVVNATGYIGNNANNNWALVTGSGSVWSNQDLNVGYYGGSDNSLVISNGGKVVTADVGVIGYANGVSANDNTALVSGNGSVWSIKNTLFVASHSSGNSLTINNGGAVNDSTGVIGYYADYNGAVVSGAGSVWSNQNLYVGYGGSGNSLVIQEGGTVLTGGGYIGYQSSGNSLVISNGGVLVTPVGGVIGYGGVMNNSALVSGIGSVWRNQDLYVGEVDYRGGGNSLVISNGGTVVTTRSGFIGYSIGYGGGGNNNTVAVSGTGSVWSVQNLYVGYEGSSNSLIIRNGGGVVDSTAFIGWQGVNNSVMITGNGSTWNNQSNLFVGYLSGRSLLRNDGGSVTVTNGSGTGTLFVLGGNVTLNAGTITVDQLTATNGANSVVNFFGGTINTKGTAVSSGLPFSVGNGISAATLNLQGGTHSFANGLLISQNAVLKGNGTIFANLTLAGTLAPGNSPGAITINGNLTLQPSSVLDIQLGGTTQGVDYDVVFVNGSVSLDGLLRVSFINGFETNVLNSEGFIVLQGNSLLGSFTNVIGSYVTTAGGEGSFYVDYVGNSVRLSGYHAVAVPEPSTLALCALASLALFAARRRSGVFHT